MLSDRLLKLLNEQIVHEFYSSNLYLQMSGWCEDKGLEGFAKFLRAHSQEEMGHMFRVFDFVADSGRQPVIGGIEAPGHQYTNVLEVFQAILKHEEFITSKINDLVEAAFSEKNFSTFNFLQWFVAEQHEEEALFKSILDKIALVGPDGSGLFFLDAEIGKITAAPVAPSESAAAEGN